jgi:type I restriction enzyme M protein
VSCYNPGDRYERSPTWSEERHDGRWRAFEREELLARDKASLDLFWLRDASMTDLENLPEPAILAQEIVENLQSALYQFDLIATDVEAGSA